MTLVQVTEILPDSVEVFLSAGIGFGECSGGGEETIRSAMETQGFVTEEVDELIVYLNEMYEEANDFEHSPEEADFNSRVEGETVYIAGMIFESSAIKALHDFAEGKQGLRIKVQAGGCSGYKNSYEYADAPDESEKVFALSDVLSIYIDGFSFDKLYGSKVSFASGLTGGGLKFDNPNAKSGCGCGKSVAF